MTDEHGGAPDHGAGDGTGTGTDAGRDVGTNDRGTNDRGTLVVVVGATGQVGHRVVSEALARGHFVRGVSRTAPSAGGARHVEGADYVELDLLGAEDEPTIAALAVALEGADAVVSATNGTGAGEAVYTVGTRRLVEAASRAGVRRLVVLSIVNAESATDYPYYAAHAEQNALALAGPVPATVVRATQFHTFLGFVRSVWPASALTRLGFLPYPRGVRLQSIDVRDVARLLVDATADEGVARSVEVGGPEVRDAEDLVRAWRVARGSRRIPVGVPMPGAIGRFFATGKNLAPEAHQGRITFEEWLRSGDVD